MGHVVLLGDSIFDNASYVPGRPPVIEQLKQELPPGWRATLLAVDGDKVEHVAEQLARLPADATHLVVSAGGNDALGESGVLMESVRTVGEGLGWLAEVRRRFRERYRAMLLAVGKTGKPLAVCTVYDSVPGLEAPQETALAGFNEVILREAFAAGVPVIDLRLTCNEKADYSPLSPIEPSSSGGAKIVRAIARMIGTHDFEHGVSSIYI